MMIGVPIKQLQGSLCLHSCSLCIPDTLHLVELMASGYTTTDAAQTLHRLRVFISAVWQGLFHPCKALWAVPAAPA
jgi:hypothetical protein